MLLDLPLCFFFFFNDTATTEIYTLSLHDALPIFGGTVRSIAQQLAAGDRLVVVADNCADDTAAIDRKSTRLNSSHDQISYAVFCLKKKKNREKSLAILTPYARRLQSVKCRDTTCK